MGSYVYVGPYQSFWFIAPLWVLIGVYRSECVFMVPYSSLCVLMGLYGSLYVFMCPYGS